MITVTVILPSLNVVGYIKKCIDSVVRQTIFDTLEILIIDAGSTDGTYEIAEWYEAHYKNIRLIKSEKKSYGYQVNLGINQAQGKYVAILETDDYVREDMYEVLYHAAEKHQVDYMKADYIRFYERRNGHRIEWKVELSKDKQKYYNRVIDTTRNAYIHQNDFNIWKGIYHRDFLIKNKIFLYESNGAAYQDIGFGQLLHSKAKRAYYMDDYLYQYRIGRDGASTNSGKGIQYAHGEFKRLLELSDTSTLYLQGLYQLMVSSLLGEFSLISDPYNFSNDYETQNSMAWMVKAINDGFRRGIISTDDFSKEDMEKFHRIEEEPRALISEQVDGKVKVIKKCIGMKTDGCPHVIFGAGIYGKRVLMLLDTHGIRVDYFLDNAAEAGDDIGGIPVKLPTADIVSEDTKYIIANKKNKEEIKEQLMRLGADEKNLIDYAE